MLQRFCAAAGTESRPLQSRRLFFAIKPGSEPEFWQCPADSFQIRGSDPGLIFAGAGSGHAVKIAPSAAGHLFTYEGKNMIKVGIVGGTGYTGVELLRLLSPIPRCS
jgi:hypothetical protein